MLGAVTRGRGRAEAGRGRDWYKSGIEKIDETGGTDGGRLRRREVPGHCVRRWSQRPTAHTMARNLLTHDGARVTVDFSQTLSPFTCCGAVQTPRGTLHAGCCPANDEAAAYTAPPREVRTCPRGEARAARARAHTLACVRTRRMGTRIHRRPCLSLQNLGAMTPKPSTLAAAGTRPRDRPDPEVLVKVRRAGVLACCRAGCPLLLRAQSCCALSPLLRIQIRALCDRERFSKRDAEEVSLHIVRLQRHEQEVAAGPRIACCTLSLPWRGGRTREQLRVRTPTARGAVSVALQTLHPAGPARSRAGRAGPVTPTFADY